MSGLVAVLAGREAPGVHTWTSAREADEVRHTAELAGWELAHLDGWTRGGERRDVLAALGAALGFPDHYGVNLDALADCLRDLGAPTVLLWDGWAVAARADEGAFGVVVRVLAERCADEVAPPFEVLLRGEGPELPVALGVTELD